MTKNYRATERGFEVKNPLGSPSVLRTRQFAREYARKLDERVEKALNGKKPCDHHIVSEGYGTRHLATHVYASDRQPGITFVCAECAARISPLGGEYLDIMEIEDLRGGE